MNICLVTPTNRPGNWARCRAMIEAAFASPARFYWRPVLYHAELDATSPIERETLFGHCTPRWISPLIIADQPRANPVALKLNAGLDQLAREGFDGWVLALSDDDFLPRRYVRHVMPGRAKGVIVTSCARGQHVTPDPGYGTDALIAAPENMVVGKVTGSQALIHASLLERLRFAHHACGDGMLLQALHEQLPGEFHFVPDCFVAFNALEPGRWEADELNKVLEAE